MIGTPVSVPASRSQAVQQQPKFPGSKIRSLPRSSTATRNNRLSGRPAPKHRKSRKRPISCVARESPRLSHMGLLCSEMTSSTPARVLTPMPPATVSTAVPAFQAPHRVLRAGQLRLRLQVLVGAGREAVVHPWWDDGLGCPLDQAPLARDVVQDSAAGAPRRETPSARWAGRGASWAGRAAVPTFVSVPYLKVRTLFAEVIGMSHGYAS